MKKEALIMLFLYISKIFLENLAGFPQFKVLRWVQ